jgi:signal transduction histidine kinase
MTHTSHEFTFRPRARLVSVLGEHLISDQAVGLIELVKNAYDADATEVSVEILNLSKPAETTVAVTDNGLGMTLDDVQLKWLSPAVNHKEREKRQNTRTPLGRLPIGEKGVGRFAVHQIGRKLEMVTRSRGQPEIFLTTDWDLFDSGDAYLDGMPLQVITRDPAELFTGDRTGTRLLMRQAQEAWNEKLLRKVHRTLRRLQSPLGEDDLRFRVKLSCPEYPAYENIDPTDILGKAHYEFRALVDRNGQCDFDYVCKHPALPPRSRAGSESLVPLAAGELQAQVPRCGPFWLNLYVWDRSKDHLQASGVSRQELDAMCGVSLFRDRLRVLPYGEPGDDWLFLDQERIQAPAERIGNNQVIGLVQVDQATNLLLRDKTNREGLIENEAFVDLRALVRGATRLFTTYWKKDRPQPSTVRREGGGTIQHARTVAVALRDTAREDIPVTIPAVQPPGGGPAGDGQPVEVVTQPQAVARLIDTLNDVEHSESERERKQEVLLHLAATGLAAERVVHEFGRQVVAAASALEELRATVRSGSPGQGALARVRTCLETLRSEFRVLAPYEAISRAPHARRISVRAAAELALRLNLDALAAAGIQSAIQGDDFQVRAREPPLVQILDNLVHNACYWVSTVPAGRDRRIAILLSPAANRILVVDSGPGVHGEAVGHLFEPFFTMRAGGTGLGLHISADLARRMGGWLRLAVPEDNPLLPDWATGAAFALGFDPASRVAEETGGATGDATA